MDEQGLAAEAPRASRTLHTTGFVITGAWILGLILYVAFSRDSIVDLAPNELGDFAAGAFAPLAFLWLVLGFFQQGEELRHSGQALWLQGRELQNSVEQQRELVKATREQLQFESDRLTAQAEELDRNAQPVLDMKSGGSTPTERDGMRSYVFHLLNHGRACTDLKIGHRASPYASQAMLQTGERASFRLRLMIAHDSDVEVPVFYRDERLGAKMQKFIILKRGPDFTCELIETARPAPSPE